MAAMSHWPLFQLDIKISFLPMRLPRKHTTSFAAAQGESGQVYHQHQSLYGLKQFM